MGSMSARSTKSSMSSVRVRSGSRASSSSGVMTTYRSFVSSKPLTIWSYDTSSPVSGSTRFCWIRFPVSALSWLNRTVLRDTAE